MFLRSVGDIAAACGGKIYNCSENLNVGIFVNNNKSIVKNCVYVAIKGESFDGNDFALDAVRRGAALVLTDGKVQKDIPRVKVDNVQRALSDIARYFRKREIKTSIAVTGSVGKTTTKEMCAALLSEIMPVHKTKGNKNNLLGVPLTVLQNTDCDVAVLEAGISEVGEMEQLSGIILPDIAIITNIGSMHSEFLGSRENIAREKLKILDFASENCILIAPENEPLLRQTKAKRTVFVGINTRECSYGAENIRYLKSGTRFDMTKSGEIFIKDAFILGIGEHIVADATYAIALADIFGASKGDILRGLKRYKPEKSRQNIIRKNGVTVMDDSYNFGPESARASLKAFNTVANKRGAQKRIIVLGSMLELGENAENEHIALGKEIAGYHFDALITVGELAKNISLGALIRGMDADKVFDFSDGQRDEAKNKLLQIATKGSAVLIKGSRKAKMEEFASLILR